MTIAFLPNVFKKVALGLFLISCGLGYECAIKGYQDAGAGKPMGYSLGKTEQHGLADWLLILSILVYFLSKERVEDELIKKWRNESLAQAFIIMVCITLALLAFKIYSVSVGSLLTGQFLLSLVLFYQKKHA